MKYSYIAKVETLDKDWKTLQNMIGDGLHNIDLPHLNHVPGKYSEYVDQLSKEELDGIYKKYEKDFEIFNYQL